MYKFSLICIFVSYVSGESVSVVTGVGTIVGEKYEGYNSFLGVPYAKVDETNPFGKSITYPKFEAPFVANNSSVMCPQAIFQSSNTLQCLQLHIYVPQSTTTTSEKLPILVWFHGGGFKFGSGGEYGGQHLAKRGIIVVSVNYRLGPYGFLCLDDPDVPGNQGMKDQIDALRWVKSNIDAFGGDPNQVTIAGESYGGGSVDLHLYSEFETLFDKAIMQSASMFYKGFYAKRDPEAAIKLANGLGHKVTNNKDAISALAKDDPLSVMVAALRLEIPTSICREKSFYGVQNFIRSGPFHMTKSDRVKNTKIMIGYNSMEWIRNYGHKNKEFWDTLGDVIEFKIKQHFVLSSGEYQTLGNMVKKFYLGEKPIGNSSVLELSEFESDFIINHSIERSVNKYTEIDPEKPIYKYLFSYNGASAYRDIAGAGTSHTDELKYLFEWETPIKAEEIPVATPEQLLVRSRMTAMWSNFVKYGNPTPEKTPELQITWTPVKGTSRPYLNIDKDLTVQANTYNRRMAFWDLVWHNYEKNSVVYDAPNVELLSNLVSLRSQMNSTSSAIRRDGLTLNTFAVYILLHFAFCLYVIR